MILSLTAFSVQAQLLLLLTKWADAISVSKWENTHIPIAKSALIWSYPVKIRGGISKAVKWENGGGYRFYELAPTLINKDEFGEYIINPDYSADMLAAAMALHEGFTYEPDSSAFWKQSHGNEKSYLFVTTRHLNAAFMDSIIGGMEDDEYLVIACCSFDKGMDKLNPRITVKKIPQMLLERCEFDKADYNLNIIHPPVYDDEEECDDEG